MTSDEATTLYLIITAVLGAALYGMGSGGWRPAAAVCVGLVAMYVATGSTYPWLVQLTVWASVAALMTFALGANVLACLFCTLSAATYLAGMTGGDPKATHVVANVWGILMLVSLLGGGIFESMGRGAVRGGLVSRLLHSRDMLAPPWRPAHRGSVASME